MTQQANWRFLVPSTQALAETSLETFVSVTHPGILDCIRALPSVPRKEKPDDSMDVGEQLRDRAERS
jgi:hypothetical protein